MLSSSYPIPAAFQKGTSGISSGGKYKADSTERIHMGGRPWSRGGAHPRLCSILRRLLCVTLSLTGLYECGLYKAWRTTELSVTTSDSNNSKTIIWLNRYMVLKIAIQLCKQFIFFSSWTYSKLPILFVFKTTATLPSSPETFAAPPLNFIEKITHVILWSPISLTLLKQQINSVYTLKYRIKDPFVCVNIKSSSLIH